MTCIVGLAENGIVYIGGDSAAVAGYNIFTTQLRKVFKIGNFIIGYTSSFRMGQLLQYHLEVRQQQDGETDERYMVVAFAESARLLFKEKGYSKVDSNVESGGTFLIGYRGTLYEMDYDFQINSRVPQIAAVGCGGEFAMGALYALSGLSAVERITQSLEISAKLSSAVIAPFIIEQMGA